VAEVLNLGEVFGPLWVHSQELQVKLAVVVLARPIDWMARDLVELREMVSGLEKVAVQEKNYLLRTEHGELQGSEGSFECGPPSACPLSV
jgi:hypothetical protein